MKGINFSFRLQTNFRKLAYKTNQAVNKLYCARLTPLESALREHEFPFYTSDDWLGAHEFYLYKELINHHFSEHDL